MFRDESSHVIQKARKTRRKSSSKKLQPDSEGATDVSSNGSPTPQVLREPTSHPVDYPVRLEQPLATNNNTTWKDDTLDASAIDSDKPPFENPAAPYQDRGISFFFSQYVAADKGCFPNYDFISDLWKAPMSPENDDAVAITAGVTAVGLAGLSKMTGCKKTMDRARQDYGVALNLTNAALQDPVEVTKDTTMLAVLLLGTYEFMSGTTPQTIQLWQKHVDGAAAVAGIRGTSQFRTKAGIRMFLLLNHSVLLSCMQTGFPMPRAILDLRKELEKLKILNKTTVRVVGHLSDTIQLRYDIKTRAITDRDDILKRLYALEADFVTIVAGLPGPMRYRIVHLDQPHPTAFDEYCHVHPGLTQMSLWNVIRTMRILVQESIIEHLTMGMTDPLALDLATRTKVFRALHLQRKLIHGVLASVPQHFGVVNWLDSVAAGCPEAVERPSSDAISTPKSTSSSSEDGSTIRIQLPSFKDTSHTNQPGGHNAARFMMLATSSNMIVWPLHTVGTARMCSAQVRTYAVERLESIYAETGFHQAHEVANMVRDRPDERWTEVYSALAGAYVDDLPTIV